jgi:hypothetical protein
MYTRIAVLFICAFTGTQALYANQLLDAVPDHSTLWAMGTAWAPDQSRVLYQEFYYAEDPALDLPTRVQYRTTDGTLIVDKSLRYPAITSAPVVQQLDYRNGARFETRITETEPPRVEVSFQTDTHSRPQQTELPVDDDLVIDAGFDVFVRSNLDALIAGRAVGARFLIPARQDTVRVNLALADTRHCPVDAAVHCFQIRPAGLLRAVSFFVDPVYLGYDLNSRRLALFRGVSNLLDDSGASQDVLITYQYP